MGSEFKSTLSLILQTATSLFLMGLIPVLIKFVSANPYTIGIVRLVIAVSLGFFFLKNKAELKTISPQSWLALMAMGLCFSLHWLSYFWSIKIATASIGILGVSTYGVHLILIGWMIGHHRPRLLDFVALTIAVIGTLIIIPKFSFNNQIATGMLLGIISGFFFALLPLFHQRLQYLSHGIRVLGQFSFALIIFSFFLPKTSWNLSRQDWIALLILSVVCTYVGHSLWVKIVTHLPTLTTSILYYLTLPVTMTLSFYFLDESMTGSKIMGAALILLGNSLGLWEKYRKSKNGMLREIVQEEV